MISLRYKLPVGSILGHPKYQLFIGLLADLTRTPEGAVFYLSLGFLFFSVNLMVGPAQLVQAVRSIEQP